MTIKPEFFQFVWRYIKSRFRHTPIWAHLFVTYRCNLDCDYCYLRFPFIQAPDMSMATFEAVLQGLLAVDCGLVAFMGGEPTLHKELSAMVAQARAAGMLTHLSTNGIRLTPDYIDELATAGLHVFNLSIDTVNPSSLSPKTLARLGDIFEVLTQKRQQYGYSIHVNQVLLPGHLDQVKPLAEYLTKRNINMTTVFAHTADSPRSLVGFDSPKTLATLNTLVERLITLKRQGYTIATSQAYLRTAQDFAGNRRMPMYCNAGRESMHIEPDGGIRLCGSCLAATHRLDLHASQLTPKRWRALRPQVEATVRNCNPICLSFCHFETAYISRHPWQILFSYLNGSQRTLAKVFSKFQVKNIRNLRKGG